VRRFLCRKSEGNRPSEDLDVEGSIKLVWIDKKC